MSDAAHTIFDTPTREEALALWQSFQQVWSVCEPKAVRHLGLNFGTCLNFYVFDRSIHSLIRSTNLLEHFFREFRTKADEIGTFPNELYCLTVFCLIVARDHAEHDRGPAAKT